MGRPGVVGIRSGIGGYSQFSLDNFNAENIAKILANEVHAFSSDANWMEPNDKFSEYVNYRKEKDPNGYLDIVAHGTKYTIIYYHNGVEYTLKAKHVAKMIKNMKSFKGNGVRLLSCNTGGDPRGFAQNLANKLGVPVLAPNNLLWTYSDKTGRLDVAPRKSNIVGNKDFQRPNLTQQGSFITFYPKGRR
ncbi:MAG: hypothetical protein K6E24_03535 [bacterium]|nr:hypothetical protein [bacterium]